MDLRRLSLTDALAGDVMMCVIVVAVDQSQNRRHVRDGGDGGNAVYAAALKDVQTGVTAR